VLLPPPSGGRRYCDPSCLLVRSFVNTSVSERWRDQRRSGAAGARGSSRTFVGKKRAQCPACTHAAAKDVREICLGRIKC